MLKKTSEFYLLTKIADNLLGENDLPEYDVPPDTHLHAFKKRYPRLPLVNLPDRYAPEKVESLIQARESARVFGNEPVALAELSKILASARVLDVKREPERRAYPSAGARFPIEVYVAAFNVECVDPGLYHFQSTDFELRSLVERDYSDSKMKFASNCLENPALTLILTTVISRSEVKYHHLAYPASLLEAGHIAQNLIFSANELGLGACPVLGQVNDFVANELDLTSHELPLYAVAVGREAK
ncbi:hypothetical protein CKO15_08095 [Halorhodospira abdelmalekii]|uniref:SagB/ThcOx family dehydrogenase n=1 Tax=Halorhodospira abdelmalekii TaxID=421629 RepID=UPI001907B795|nr:SagB/ThcOx family dehydrogenase [Halorhodospira abdelmalekii]MBK1735246.1 hypothetical protein [Halorhodospira abdelmalekii]